MTKKFKIGSYLNILAAVAGVVGVVGMAVSSGIDSAYALKTLTSLILMGAGGVCLCLAAVYAPAKFGNHDILSTACVIGAIALFMTCLGTLVADRVLMIAGLFSYNSQNMVGWKVFYATVVGAGGFVIASLLLIIGAFTKSVKEA